MTEGELIKKYRQEKGYSLRALSEIINISPSTLSRIERGEAQVGWNELMNFCNVLGIDKNLMTQVTINERFQGDFVVKKKGNNESIIFTTQQMRSVNKLMSKLNDKGQNKVVDYAKDIKLSGNYDIDEPQAPFTLSEDYAEFYTDAGAAAGSGAYNSGYDDGHCVCAKIADVPDYDAIVDVRGDSMEPTIKDGDVAFVDFNFDKKDGEIYIVQHEDDTYIKRCYFESDKLTLRSDNPDYNDIVFQDQDNVRVIGIVTNWATPER